MNKLLIISLSFILVSCVRNSGVVAINDGAYLISRSEKGFDVTGSRVKADAIKKAHKFCDKQGKSLHLISTHQKDMVPFTSDAQAEIQFTCK